MKLNKKTPPAGDDPKTAQREKEAEMVALRLPSPNFLLY